jgi:hypothetical protein
MLLALLGTVVLVACDGAGGAAAMGGSPMGGTNGAGGHPMGMGGATTGVYAFDSQWTPGESSVSNSGQMARHALIAGLKAQLQGLQARIDDESNPYVPQSGDVVLLLDLFFSCPDAACGQETLAFMGLDAPVSQRVFDDIAAEKNLVGKLAGNDAGGQHAEWTVAGAMVGWGDETPAGLVQWIFQEMEAAAIARANGVYATDPSGAEIATLYVTGTGLDLAELLQKFLLGAIAFSQGADDYLDDDTTEKGLLADNTQPVEGKPYTALEHNWDEGFGYFGAARDFAAYTDDEIAGKGGRSEYAHGYHDTNGDGEIDLRRELNWGHAVNAAKRDRSATTALDLTRDAFDAFVAGRALITVAGGALSEAQRVELGRHRDQALQAWEKAIAATVIHYLNAMLGDIEDGGDFATYAKHFSELKGFALSFQFNRRSPLMSDDGADFAELHRLLGTRPAPRDADDIADYAINLTAARTLVGAAYGFDVADVENW